MKSFAIFAIIAATVSAEDGYTCDQKELTSWAAETGVSDLNDADTIANCKMECDTKATEDNTDKDSCCYFTKTDDSTTECILM